MMRNRRILNIRFAAAMAVVIVLVGGSIHVVHAVQERRLAASLLTRADLAQREGDLERAEKYLGRYMTARPEDDDAFGRYALLLARAAANDAQRLRTLEVLERAIGRDSGRIELRRAAVDLAMLPALGRFRTADEHLESLLKAKPDDGELEELRGLCHEALAREARDPQIELQLANDWYVKAIAHSPDRIVAHERRAILLRGPLAKTPEAEQAADALMDARAEKSGIVARNPKSAAAYLARARYRRANKIAGADADVARALVLAPDDTETILAASEQSKQAGDLDAARRHLERGVAATRGTPDPRLYQALAAVEIRANRSDEAAKVLARGLEARPGDVLLLWDLADVLIGAGRVDDAEKQALAILKKNPTFHPAGLAFLEGRVEIARGHWIEAVALLERARALAGTAPGLAELNKQADLLLADGYGRLGNPERQLAACRRVLAIDPASVPARRGQTAALLTLGRDDDALEEYRKAPNPDSASRLVAARLLIARQARVAEPRRDWTEVDRILGEVRQAEPESLELALLQAEVQSLRGQADLARATLEQARTKHPDQPGPWIGLIALAARSPKPETALAVIDEARKALGDRVDLRLVLARYWVSRGGPEARKNLETLASGIDAFKGEDRNRLLDGLADAFARSGDRKRAVQLWTRLAEARPDDARVATLLLDLALETEPADGPAVKQAIERLRRVEGPDGALWRYAEAARIVIRARAGDKGDLGRARELLAEVAARRPEWSRVPLMTAEIAEIAGEPEVAAESYLQAIDHGERQPVVVRRAVKHLNALRRFSDADRVLRKLTDETEPAGILAQLVADNSLRRGDQSRALEMARRAVPAESKDYRDQIWLGRVSWATGRKDEAGQAMARAVELAPEAPEAWVARVEYLVRTGAKTEAEDAIRQAATKLPADRVPITMATCFEIVGQLEKAEEQYKIALSASPRNAAALRAVVDFYLRRGQNEKAAPYLGMILDPATKADPATIRWTRRKIALGEATSGNFLDVKKALAEVDRNIQETGAVEDLRVRALLMAKLPGGRREAIRAFEELGRSQSPTPDEKFLLGYLLLEDHDWPKARKMLLSALVANGENVVYLSTFIRGALAQGSVEEAGPWLEKLERLLPKNGQTIELKARAFAKQGRPDEAVKILDDYARTKDAPIGVIAALLEELGQIDAAEARYRDFVARSTQPEAVLALAEFLARRDKLSEALDLWEKAWEKADPVTVSHSGVIMLYSARMPGPDAYRRLGDRIEKAARANRGAVSFQFDLANVWSHQGRYRETEALYRRIAEMSRSSEGPLNNLAWLLAAAEGKGQEALSLVNRAMEMGGPRAEYLDTRGVVYLSLNRPQDAIADLERSIATMPTPDAYLHLAQARLTTHEATAARDALAKAKDAGLKVETLHPVERKAYEKTLAALGPG